MEQNSGESRSGEAMSIFGQSIDARRPPRSRRRATQKKFSPAAESPATPSVERQHQRRAVAERERARAESELSRASSMANELEQQIEQANARTRSHRPELHGTRAGGSRRRKSPVGVGVGADQAQDQSNSLYVEVMHELDLVKRELRQLQHEVKAAREAQTPTPTRVSTSGSRRLDGVTREAGGGGNEGRRGIAELSKQPGGYREATRRARGESLQGDTSRGSDADERFATASSSDVGIESADTKAMVPTTAATRGHAVENGESALAVITPRREEEEAAEAELLTSARTELASIKEEGARLTSSMERTRREAARVAEEIARLAEQEERAGAQVRQLNARLHRARSRLGAATAADEAAEAALAEQRAALRRLGEEAEAAEKGREMAEHERRRVMEDAEGVAAEAAAAERRVRESVGELEAARAAEAAAAEELRAIAVGAATRERAAQRSGNNVTIPRFEYEYLAGRGEVVRAVAEKKVAAAEAWVEALRAGEKEVVMRTEVIETEIREMAAAGEAVDADDDPRDDEEREPRVGGLQRAQTRRRPAPPKENEVLPATLRRTGTVVARKPRPLSFVLQGKKRRASVPKCMKCFGGRC